MIHVWPYKSLTGAFCLNIEVQATVREEKKLMVENTKLKRDIEQLKQTLLEKEKSRGGT